MGYSERIIAMDNRIYEIFLQCFPQFPMGAEAFSRLLDAENCEIIESGGNGSPVGFAAVKGNEIRLLCVEPRSQGKGIGSELLRRSEEIIAGNGHDRAVLGGTDSELFIGAVAPEEQWNDMHCYFFEDRGYTASDGCIEMKMPLSGFTAENIPKCPSDVTFGYCPEEKRSELFEAVRLVDEEWLQYFKMGSPVFTASRNGKLVGFCIVDVNAETLISTKDNNIGMIGCVGVIPEARRNGIGLSMVARAMTDVRSKGCDEAFIHYTHLDWWYGKLGFSTFLHYWFGTKKLK